MHLTVTGSSGLVGTALRHRLKPHDTLKVQFLSRQIDQESHQVSCPDLQNGSVADWKNTLQGSDCVVHLAAALPWSQIDSKALHQINVQGTLAVAKAALAVGVKKFIFMSTLGVHGVTSGERPFTAASPIRPSGKYAQTKYEAECALAKIAANHMELVVLRPPLVYGRGVGGKFGYLSDRIAAGKLLPVPCVKNNRRQMISADNLADVVALCLERDNITAPLLPADSEAVSTVKLLELIAQSHKQRLRLVPVPGAVVSAFQKFPIIGQYAERMVGNVEVKDEQLYSMLKWRPPFRLRDEILKIKKESL